MDRKASQPTNYYILSYLFLLNWQKKAASEFLPAFHRTALRTVKTNLKKHQISEDKVVFWHADASQRAAGQDDVTDSDTRLLFYLPASLAV